MTETWICYGHFWTFPIDVVWSDEFGMYGVDMPKIPLLEIQKIKLGRFLSLRAKWSAQNRWWYSKKLILAFAEPWDKDPELAVNWRSSRPHSPSRFHDPNKVLRDDFEDFCRQLSEEGIYPSAQDAEAAFTATCNLMLHWLVRLKKPVDLGFVKLHPTPYRSNWKQLILANDVWATRRGRYETAARWGFLKTLFNDERLCAFNISNGRAAWSVEVEMRRDWFDCSEAYEATHKSHRYANYWWKLKNWLNNNGRKFYSLYASYLLETNRPYIQLRRGTPTVSGRRSGYRTQLAGYPKSSSQLTPTPAWVAVAKRKTEIPCVEIRLVGETQEGLLPLSDLRPFEVNLWPHWKPSSVKRQRNKRKHNLKKVFLKRGLLVLDADEGKVKDPKLLVV